MNLFKKKYLHNREKGKKLCIKFLTFFITLVLSFVLFSESVSAYIPYYGSSIKYKEISSATLYYNNGGYINFTLDDNGGAYAAVSNISNVSGVDYLALRFNGSIAMYNLLTIVLKTQAPIGTYPNVGWMSRSQAYSVIDVTYGEYGTTFITLYLDQSLTGEIDLTPVSFPYTATSINIHSSFISAITLQKMPSSSQIDTISDTLSSMLADLDVTNANVNNLNTSVTNILYEIRDMNSNTERTADAVEEQNEKDNQDRQDIEQQSGSTETEANEQADEATQTGTSLFSAFTQLLSALTNVNGNSCTLPAMQVYTLNLGNMNLCQYDIPPQIMALVSIGMVFIIIPLGINLVKRMISLYKEITG